MGIFSRGINAGNPARAFQEAILKTKRILYQNVPDSLVTLCRQWAAIPRQNKCSGFVTNPENYSLVKSSLNSNFYSRCKSEIRQRKCLL